jgi:hypothetical protein
MPKKKKKAGAGDSRKRSSFKASSWDAGREGLGVSTFESDLGSSAGGGMPKGGKSRESKTTFEQDDSAGSIDFASPIHESMASSGDQGGGGGGRGKKGTASSMLKSTAALGNKIVRGGAGQHRLMHCARRATDLEDS